VFLIFAAGTIVVRIGPNQVRDNLQWYLVLGEENRPRLLVFTGVDEQVPPERFGMTSAYINQFFRDRKLARCLEAGQCAPDDKDYRAALNELVHANSDRMWTFLTRYGATLVGIADASEGTQALRWSLILLVLDAIGIFGITFFMPKRTIPAARRPAQR
jgi:hypothetical protein